MLAGLCSERERHATHVHTTERGEDESPDDAVAGPYRVDVAHCLARKVCMLKINDAAELAHV